MHDVVTSADIAVNLLVFVLSTFLGLGLIRHVSKLLHTPLMSMTNAISAITILGALLLFDEAMSVSTGILGAIAIVMAVFNIAGGFVITDRILRLFKKG